MRIQIIKPTADQTYDDAVNTLLSLIIVQLDSSYSVTHDRAETIRCLSAAFKDLVGSSHVIVSPTETDEPETIGNFVKIDKDTLEIPDRLQAFLDDRLRKGQTDGTQRNTE